MKTLPGWQDLVAVLAALAAGGWLFRRWLLKRRAGKGCDQCAAMMHSRMPHPTTKANPER